MTCSGSFWRCVLLATALPSVQVSPAAEQSAVFCAYNVRNWLVMDRFENNVVVKDAAKSNQEKTAVIQTLTAIRPDILGLSEIGSAADLHEIQMLLKQSGIDLPHFEVAQGGDTARRLGLLSRFPIRSRQSPKDLTYNLDGRVMQVQRGFLDVTLELPGEFALRCLGVHFKSKREVFEGDQALMRRHEADLLRRHIDRILEKAPDSPLIAYGDFNDYRNEPALKAVQGSRTGPGYLDDLRPADHLGEVWTHYWATADVYSRIDYLFVNRALKPLVQREGTFIYRSPDFATASDHRPVVTTLSWPAAAGK